MSATKKIRASNGISYTTGGIDYSNPQAKTQPAAPVKVYPKPLQDRVIVTKKKPETISKGGIIMPEFSIPNESEGFVVAVGPKVGAAELAVAGTTGSVPVILKPGDHVKYGQYAGTEFEWEGEELLIMRESDVLMILP